MISAVTNNVKMPAATNIGFSVERGEPAQFGVTQVISGWTEALMLMPVGSKWKVFLPTEIAYGANPRPGGPIESNMALIFEIELISID